jgi:hypothetical protein
MKRRTFVASLFCTPFAARGEAPPARVGFLHPRLSAIVEPMRLAAVRQGLSSAGI